MLKFDVSNNKYCPRFIFFDRNASYSGYDKYFWYFNYLINLIIQNKNQKNITTFFDEHLSESFLKSLQRMGLIKYKTENIKSKLNKTINIKRLYLYNIKTYELKMILSVLSNENFIKEPYGKEKQIALIKQMIKEKYNKFENEELIIKQSEISEEHSNHIEFLGVIFYLEENNYIEIIKKENIGEAGEVNLYFLIKENNLKIRIKQRFKKEIKRDRLTENINKEIKTENNETTNKIDIFIDKNYGIYKNKKTKKPCYPLKETTKRFKILKYLNKSESLSPTMLGNKVSQSYSALNKAIKEINENFLYNLNLKQDLIIQSPTKAYLLNKDKYNIILK